MSQVYINEPPTSGKVILHTSFGDVDIELWTREAPKACENFLQLCLDGYYDRTIFHRIVKGFMAQGGDPTGTGHGGESIYGQEFADEFHQRLKFAHRGRVACASNGPNTNGSQFFITLDRCDWLDKKHTIFGKVVGNTIFNVLRLDSFEVGPGDRPLHPPHIIATEVVLNPFENMVQRALVSKPQATPNDAKEKKPKGKSDLKLLSFGNEEEAYHQDIKSAPTIRIKSAHDVANDPRLLPEPAVELKPSNSSSAPKSSLPLPPPGSSLSSKDEEEKIHQFEERMRSKALEGSSRKKKGREAEKIADSSNVASDSDASDNQKPNRYVETHKACVSLCVRV